jgi:hypothetical protein
MIVAIIVYWYYTEKHFDKDEEWMRMEFEDRRPDQFRRQMAENAKLQVIFYGFFIFYAFLGSLNWIVRLKLIMSC